MTKEKLCYYAMYYDRNLQRQSDYIFWMRRFVVLDNLWLFKFFEKINLVFYF